MARRILGYLTAFVMRILTRGRMQGRCYLIRLPATVKIARGSKVLIGNNVMIGPRARIVANGGTLRIGDRTFVGHNATLVAYSDLDIDSDVLIAENCSLHTENHGPPNARDQFTSFPISVGDRSWLGAGVVVLAGASIGKEVTVGANAVVTGDLVDGRVYVGVPARPIRGAAGA